MLIDMNRKEFLMELERLLKDISGEEREEAIAYYNGYFEDAGAENEGKVIRELGSPEQVAKTIKADMGIADEPEYTEYGYRASWQQDNKELLAPKAGSERESGERHSSRLIWIVLLAALTSPIWLPVVTGILGAVVGGLISVFVLVIVFAIAVAACYIAGFLLIGAGILELASGITAAGFALAGTGFMFFALAVLGTIACVWIFGRFVPWFVKLLPALFYRLRSRRKAL